MIAQIDDTLENRELIKIHVLQKITLMIKMN